MRFVLISLLVLFDRVIPISLVILVGVVLAWQGRWQKVMTWMVMLGLVHDVMWVRPLGSMSLVMVVIGGVIVFLRQRFERGTMVLVGSSVVVAEVVYQWWVSGGVAWQWVGAQLVLGLGLWYLMGVGVREEDELFLNKR